MSGTSGAAGFLLGFRKADSNFMASLYTDDILLIAASWEEMRQKLCDTQAVLRPLGLRLAWEKCKLLKSPSLPTQELHMDSQLIEEVQTLVFLGILLGWLWGIFSNVVVCKNSQGNELLLCALS